MDLNPDYALRIRRALTASLCKRHVHFVSWHRKVLITSSAQEIHSSAIHGSGFDSHRAVIYKIRQHNS